MKKNKLFLTATLAVASFALLTGFRPAGPGPSGKDPARMQAHIEQRMERALDRIDATDQQRAEIGAVKDRLVARMQGQRGERRAQRQEMRSIWSRDEVSASELRAKVDERIERQREAAYARADAMAEVHRILTPEQRAELAKTMQQKAGKRFQGKKGQRGADGEQAPVQRRLQRQQRLQLHQQQ